MSDWKTRATPIEITPVPDEPPAASWRDRAAPATAPVDIPFGEEKVPDMSMRKAITKDVAEALSNVPGSALELGKNIAQPVIHPIDTAKGVYKVATDPETRAAVGQFYKDRYGGIENLHNTLIKDPVGAVSDLATVLTLGGGLAAKAPGIVGKAGEIVAKTGNAIDPIANAGRVAKAAGVGAGKAAANILGYTTSAGGDAIKTAAQAGFKGEKSFMLNLQDKVPVTKVIDDLQDGLDAIKQKSQAEYRAQMAGLPDVKIDPTPIHQELTRILQDAASPGPLPLAKKTAGDTMSKIQELQKAIDDATTTTQSMNVPSTKTLANGSVIPWNQWVDVKVPKPVDVFELDALKQKLADFYRQPGERTPHVQRAITALNQKIRDVIGTEAPEYAQIMNKYGDAQEMLDDMRSALSAKNSVQADTTLMKLRRTLNDSPQGKRGAKMIDQIEAETGQSLKPAIAGQSLQNWMPGNGNYVGKALGSAKAIVGLGAGAGTVGPGAILAAPAFSPRAMGYAAYNAGRAASVAPPVFDALVPTVERQRLLAQVGRPLDDERVKRALTRAGIE